MDSKRLAFPLAYIFTLLVAFQNFSFSLLVRDFPLTVQNHAHPELTIHHLLWTHKKNLFIGQQ